MQFLKRLKMGLVLTKDSLLVIRRNPKLMLFPLVSGIAGIAFLALFLGVTFGLAAINPEGGLLVGLFLIYLMLTFISSFFTAGLVHQTGSVFAGNDPSLKAGLAAAWDRKTPLFIWSLIAATIGILINALENSNSTVSRIFATLFSIGWTLMTFLIIPVIVFERTSTVGMFKESGRKFKQTFGETPVSLFAITLISFVIAIPFYAGGFFLLQAGSTIAGIGTILAGILTAFLISQTLQGVVKTSLYFYAEKGKKPSEFDNVDFNNLNDDRSSQQPTTGTTGGFRGGQ